MLVALKGTRCRNWPWDLRVHGALGHRVPETMLGCMQGSGYPRASGAEETDRPLGPEIDQQSVPRSWEVESGASPKMLSKSVRNNEKTGAGIFKVGAKTMPTFLTVILLTSELLTITIKNCESARNKAKFGFGSLCTRAFKAVILFCRSSSSSAALVHFLNSLRSEVAYAHQGRARNPNGALVSTLSWATLAGTA